MSPEQTAMKRLPDNFKGCSSTATHSTSVDGKTLFNRLVEDIGETFQRHSGGLYSKSLKLAHGSHAKEFSSSQAASVEAEILDDSLLRAVTTFMQQNSNKRLLTAWLSVAGPCNMRELKGDLDCALLCRVHAASLQRELVINIIRYIARNSMHFTHAK